MIEQYGTIIKLGLYMSIIGMIIGFWQWDRKQAYSGGYDKARVEMLEQFQKDLGDVTKVKNKQLDDAIASHTKQKDKDAELIKELMKKPKVEYRDVIKVVKTMQCKSLGDGGLELWKSITKEPAGFSRGNE